MTFGPKNMANTISNFVVVVVVFFLKCHFNRVKSLSTFGTFGGSEK